jgi:hypothetical protein
MDAAETEKALVQPPPADFAFLTNRVGNTIAYYQSLDCALIFAMKTTVSVDLCFI